MAGCPFDLLAKNDVIWNSPSEDSRGSMPLGNGDIGLNVWMETNCDLVFYISKNDAWTDNVDGDRGLPKMGRVRVRFSPPLATDDGFVQRLSLAEGAVEIQSGSGHNFCKLRIWMDANRPLIHADAKAAAPHNVQVLFETTRPFPRKDLAADTILTNQSNRIVWFYRNRSRQNPQLINRTFGAAITGDDLISTGPNVLHSQRSSMRQEICLCVLTAQSPTPGDWLADLNQTADRAGSVPLPKAWRQHVDWWRSFWNRSWIFASGSQDASNVTSGYVLQRFVSACASRGDYPIKFNGSLFTMDWHETETLAGIRTNCVIDADARGWGGQYWFQNTRAMYWPMLESGDFDLMKPLFRMYREKLAGNAREVRDFYHHDGACFAETRPFYGGINRLTFDMPGRYTDFYYTPILELSAMGLDYYRYTCDTNFARQILLPVADAGVTFFDEHWPHQSGKLLLDPDSSTETYWKARNPAPDIAGLRWVLSGLLSLPDDLSTPDKRSRWMRLLREIPELPVGISNGIKVLLPAEHYGMNQNVENPELYSVYPFRIFGLHKRDLGLARATFAARRFKDDGCWRQSGIQAALLGDTPTAQKNVVYVLQRKDPQCRFPAFWARGSDYVPDEDNGGNGVNTLQLMLMQSEGRNIYLLPAWPREWNAVFKLYAPSNTTVEGRVELGRIVSLTVDPPERRNDVVLPN